MNRTNQSIVLSKEQIKETHLLHRKQLNRGNDITANYQNKTKHLFNSIEKFFVGKK